MKLFLTAIALTTLFSACYKKPEQPSEIAVTKTVQFHIANGKDYSSTIYNGLNAEVKLSFAKESTTDGKVLKLWDTTFSLRNIRSYPELANPIIFSKHFDDVFESNQAVRISRVIKYIDAAGPISQSAFGETIPFGVTSKQFNVHL